jgi:hypothetical protein
MPGVAPGCAARRAGPFVAAAVLAGGAAFAVAGLVDPARTGAGAWTGLLAGAAVYAATFAATIRLVFRSTWHSLLSRALRLGGSGA